jgi:hypothetical protein
MTSLARKRGTPRPAGSYRAARRNGARDIARPLRPAGVPRQAWRFWQGVTPNKRIDPTVRMRKVVWLNDASGKPVPVRTPRAPAKCYPAGWLTMAERRQAAERYAVTGAL